MTAALIAPVRASRADDERVLRALSGWRQGLPLPAVAEAAGLTVFGLRAQVARVRDDDLAASCPPEPAGRVRAFYERP